MRYEKPRTAKTLDELRRPAGVMQLTDEEYLQIYGVKPCLAGRSRGDITQILSCRLESDILARRNAWACWAAEVKLWPDDKRVDYIDFCPHKSISNRSAGAVERGQFAFFEVKSCMDDLTSGHGTNFEGDENWLVCPIELVEEMRQTQTTVPAGILALGEAGNGRTRFVRLQKERADGMGHTIRRRSAAELLYSMTRAGIRKGRR